MSLSSQLIYDPNLLRPNSNLKEPVSDLCRVRGLGRTLTPLDGMGQGESKMSKLIPISLCGAELKSHLILIPSTLQDEKNLCRVKRGQVSQTR